MMTHGARSHARSALRKMRRFSLFWQLAKMNLPSVFEHAASCDTHSAHIADEFPRRSQRASLKEAFVLPLALLASSHICLHLFLFVCRGRKVRLLAPHKQSVHNNYPVSTHERSGLVHLLGQGHALRARWWSKNHFSLKRHVSKGHCP